MSSLSSPRELKGKNMIIYAMGAIAQMAPYGLYSSYTYQYYVYTIKLDPMYTSIGIFLGLFLYALSAPLFGVMADNRKPTKLGKRKPFLLIGSPIQAVLMILLWTPPIFAVGDPSGIWTAIYLWVISVFLNFTQAMNVSVYLSMLSDQCQTESNRVKTASLQGVFSILGTFISILFPIILQSQIPDPQNPAFNTPSGEILLRLMPWIGAAYGIIGMVIFFIIFFVIDESFYLRESSGLPASHMSAGVVFQKIFSPVHDKNFRFWIGNVSFFNMAMRVMMTVLLPVLTFVLWLDGIQFVVFLVLLLPFAAGGFILWKKLITFRGLKYSYLVSLTCNVIALISALLFLIEFSEILRFILGVFILGTVISAIVGGFLFPNPIISSLIDQKKGFMREENATNNEEITGSYFGMHLFSMSLASGIANIILGMIFTGGNETNRNMIIWSLPITALITVISMFFLSKLKIPSKK